MSSTANTIASAEQFKKALLTVHDNGLPKSHLNMLKAQYRAPNATITATQLAKAAKYKSYNAANLQYGTLACKIAEILGYTPEKRSDGSPRCWTTLSYAVTDTSEPDTGHFQFIMRPELVEALHSIAWFTPLQNRVNPYSDLEAVSSKGTLMGNRRKLHNKNKVIEKKWNGQRWIYCLLECEGIQRELMAPGLYTELFFLDEATALSAGHRPCSSCLPKKVKDFSSKWLIANSSFHKLPDAKLTSIDNIIHSERIDQADCKVTYTANASGLPDGVIIELDSKPYLKWKNRLLEWSHDGYVAGRDIPTDAEVKVLTPISLVRSIENGFAPDVHPSASKYCS